MDDLDLSEFTPEQADSLRKSIRQAKRGEYYHMYPKWKRVYNPFLRKLYWYRHHFGNGVI